MVLQFEAIIEAQEETYLQGLADKFQKCKVALFYSEISSIDSFKVKRGEWETIATITTKSEITYYCLTDYDKILKLLIAHGMLKKTIVCN